MVSAPMGIVHTHDAAQIGAKADQPRVEATLPRAAFARLHRGKGHAQSRELADGEADLRHIALLARAGARCTAIVAQHARRLDIATSCIRDW